MYKRFFILLAFKYVESEMIGYVIGGAYAGINTYPHAVFLDIVGDSHAICAGSILNQNVVLSAAHCFDEYQGRTRDTVLIKYGSNKLSSMTSTVMKHYRLHSEYEQFTLDNDISLLRCKTPIKLGNLVKRVAIMRTPPLEKMAYVSGWGVINNQQDLASSLKYAQQQLQSGTMCGKYLSLPDGTFCAGTIKGEEHPGIGDSGGALMINKYIQIGIVSFKEDPYSLVVYTNVSYHYTWIKKNAAFLYCYKSR